MIKLTSAAFMATVFALLTGCQTAAPNSQAALAADPMRVGGIGDQFWTIVDQPNRVASRFSGKTARFFGKQHGTQVEFLAANGQTFLWYPGNQRIVTGLWRTELNARSRQTDLCFNYESTSSNPVTGQQGGSWECAHSIEFLSGLYEATVGDPFDLSSGTVPFVLPRGENVPFAFLAERAGLAPPKPYNIGF